MYLAPSTHRDPQHPAEAPIDHDDGKELLCTVGPYPEILCFDPLTLEHLSSIETPGKQNSSVISFLTPQPQLLLRPRPSQRMIVAGEFAPSAPRSFVSLHSLSNPNPNPRAEDVDVGKPLRTASGWNGIHSHSIWGLCYLGGGISGDDDLTPSLLVSGDDNEKILVWKLDCVDDSHPQQQQKPELVARIHGHRLGLKQVFKIVQAPPPFHSQHVLACGSREYGRRGNVVLINCATTSSNRIVASFPDHGAPVQSIAVDRDKSALYTVADRCLLRVFDLRDSGNGALGGGNFGGGYRAQGLVGKEKLGARGWCLTLCEELHLLAVGLYTGDVELWDLRGGVGGNRREIVRRISTSPSPVVEVLAVRKGESEERLFVSVSWAGLQLWGARKGDILACNPSPKCFGGVVVPGKRRKEGRIGELQLRLEFLCSWEGFEDVVEVRSLMDGRKVSLWKSFASVWMQ